MLFSEREAELVAEPTSDARASGRLTCFGISAALRGAFTLYTLVVRGLVFAPTLACWAADK